MSTENGLPARRHWANWQAVPGDIRIVPYLFIAAAGAALLLLALWLHARRLGRRDNSIRALLDGADALERQLQECRERMRHLRDMLTILPEEMSAQADHALRADAKVQAALKDLLAHRLWIQHHAATATQRQLDDARGALDQSGATLQAQLDRLAAIAADLQRAQTDARTVKRGRPA
jgi:chromosome segregation ATPase